MNFPSMLIFWDFLWKFTLRQSSGLSHQSVMKISSLAFGEKNENFFFYHTKRTLSFKISLLFFLHKELSLKLRSSRKTVYQHDGVSHTLHIVGPVNKPATIKQIINHQYVYNKILNFKWEHKQVYQLAFYFPFLNTERKYMNCHMFDMETPIEAILLRIPLQGIFLSKYIPSSVSLPHGSKRSKSEIRSKKSCSKGVLHKFMKMALEANWIFHFLMWRYFCEPKVKI